MRQDTRPLVLLIDDQADYLEVLEIGLSARYSVVVAQNGLDGYALACREQPDAIVIDLMMPTVDGWTVLRKLRVNPDLTDTPVIVVTAVDRNTIKRTAAHFQVAAILQKPCTADDVSAAVSAALEAAGPRGAEPIHDAKP
jgi:two-component system alkaline phosphatase synthesis response regulator PhoP